MDVMRLILMLIVVGVAALLYFWWQGGHPKNTAPVKPDVVQLRESDPYLAADAAFFENDCGKAVGLYRKAIQEKADSDRAADAYYRIAKCLEDLGQKADAIKAYDMFADKYPSDSKVRMARERSEYLRAGG
jgi:tetratricopeptide (TPR) repeat protein